MTNELSTLNYGQIFKPILEEARQKYPDLADDCALEKYGELLHIISFSTKDKTRSFTAFTKTVPIHTLLSYFRQGRN